jgi:peptidoglycan lytic transglycosylase
MRRVVWILGLAIVSLYCGGAASRVPAPAAALRLETAADKRAAFVQAYEAFGRGDLASALPLFTTLASAYPELGDYHLYFAGVIHLRLGHDADAEAALAQVLRAYPQSVKASAAALELGRLLMRAGRIAEARPVLQRALNAAETATVENARLELALADERAGAIPAAFAALMYVRRNAIGSAAAHTAKQHVQALRATHPELAPASADRLDEARLLLAEHDYAAAEALARQVVQQPDGTDPADALRVVADAVSASGRTEAGLRVLRDLVDHYPNSAAAPDALLRLGAVLWNRDQDEDALRIYQEFVRRYPQQAQAAEALYAIGRIRERAGRSQAAIDAYAELVRRHPESKTAAEARWRIGWIHYGARDWSPAAAAFEQLATRAPGSRDRTQALYWQARALEQGGRRDPARTRYQQIVEESPNDYYALWAEQRLRAAAALGSLGLDQDGTAARTHDPPASVTSDPPPATDPFHFTRWDELKAAGVYSLARGELAAVERNHSDDDTTLRYVLRAYQTVDGYAAALRLLRRLEGGLKLSSAERDRLLHPLAFWTIVRQEASANGVDPLLVEAMMRQESLFDPEARSSADARGLLQLLPATAQRVASGGGVDAAALTQPEVNIRLGVRYLSTLLARFGGDALKAIAAYNGGENAMTKWEQRFTGLEADAFVESITYRETRDYVKRVVTNYRTYQQLYR